MSWCGGGEIRPDPRGGVPRLGDVRIHLVARKLAALTRFGALRHLDLDVGGVDQVVAGDPEASGRDLLDRAAPARVVEPVGVFAAFAAVGAAAERVHGDRHRLVGLGGDRAVAHRAGVEPGEDRLDGFHLVQRHGIADTGLELEQPAQRAAVAGQPVRPRRSTAEDVVAAGPRRMLKQEDDFRGEQVQLALATERVLAADLEAAVHAFGRVLRIGAAVAELDLLGQDVETDAAELGRRAGEVLVDDVAVQPDRLERLGARVGARRSRCPSCSSPSSRPCRAP